MMYASILDTIQVVELVVVTLAAGGGIGVGVGRFTKRAYKDRKQEEIKFQAEHKAITEALLGVPATPWEPEHQGLIAAMVQVQQGYADLDDRVLTLEQRQNGYAKGNRGKIQDDRGVPDTYEPSPSP
jgi:hypothetical protein